MHSKIIKAKKIDLFIDAGESKKPKKVYQKNDRYRFQRDIKTKQKVIHKQDNTLSKTKYINLKWHCIHAR